MSKVVTIVLWALLLAVLFAPLGWLAYCEIAPDFGLPPLTWWHFVLTCFVGRCVTGARS